jgi:hypothetical protein
MCYVIICPVGCDEHVINKLSKALNMPHNLKITFPPANLRILFWAAKSDIEDINVEIIKRKFRWIGHTLRKEDGEIAKSALF